MTTLREHLEAIRDRNAGVEGSIDDSPFDHADAVAALEQLDNLTPRYTTRNQLGGEMRWRLVPDPERDA